MNALPFACIRPAPERAAHVAALPYDVFTSEEAAAYVRERPLSFLNIDRPETQFEPGHDPYAPEVYECAVALLHDELAAGIYNEDDQAAYYVYELGCEPAGAGSPTPAAGAGTGTTGGAPLCVDARDAAAAGSGPAGSGPSPAALPTGGPAAPSSVATPAAANGPTPAAASGPTPAAARTQTGIVAVCPIDDFLSGTIREHEKTRPEKELDRINHIRALGAQTGPIFLSHRDAPALGSLVEAATAAPPLYDFIDAEGCHQRVWRVSDPAHMAAIRAAFDAVPVAYIADGHHRTASAVRVGLERRAAAQASGTFTGREPFNFVLCVLFPANQLQILPYNRVVFDRRGLSAAELVSAVSAAGFDVTRSRRPVEPSRLGVIGMYCGGAWWRLRVRPFVEGEAVRVDPVSALDLSILQDRVLGPILGIDDPRTSPRIRFVGGVRGTAELERLAGTEGVAFSVHATGIQQLFAVADAGLLMPPKSTWFEPKLRSGLFIHRI